MNYRQFYEKQTGVKIEEGFEVHHLDLNRENNLIENLVSIPKKLHAKYHKYHLKFKTHIIPIVVVPIPNGLNTGFYSEITSNYFSCCELIDIYQVHKMRLLNNLNKY